LVDSCVAGTPTTEICDGIDNNCNGTVDDGIAAVATTCGVGECASTGSRTCQGCQLVDSCVVGTPTPEICDGIDNNCNGQVDENNPGGGGACTTGLPGICSPGTTSCESGAIVCVQSSQPSSETCDGLDNNCDGQVDENDPGGGEACITGLPGVCSAGTTTCQIGSLTCVQSTQSSDEVCDGLDNNCDGVVDEGCP